MVEIDIYLLTFIFLICMWGSVLIGRIIGISQTIDLMQQKGVDVKKLFKDSNGIT